MILDSLPNDVAGRCRLICSWLTPGLLAAEEGPYRPSDVKVVAGSMTHLSNDLAKTKLAGRTTTVPRSEECSMFTKTTLGAIAALIVLLPTVGFAVGLLSSYSTGDCS